MDGTGGYQMISMLDQPAITLQRRTMVTYPGPDPAGQVAILTVAASVITVEIFNHF